MGRVLCDGDAVGAAHSILVAAALHDERHGSPRSGPPSHDARARPRSARPLLHRSQPPCRVRDCARRADRRRRMAPVRGRAACRDSRPRRGRGRCSGRHRLRNAGTVPPHRAHRAVHSGPDRGTRRKGGGSDERSRPEGRGPGSRRTSRGGNRGRDGSAGDGGAGAQSRIRVPVRTRPALAALQARRDPGRPHRHRGR